jgi:hypothetical protein
MVHPAPTNASRSSWEAYDTVEAALRRIARGDIADALRVALQGGATGTEILGRIGLVLWAHDGVRRRLTADERRAWDVVMRDVNRSQPPGAFTYWLRRLFFP